MKIVSIYMNSSGYRIYLYVYFCSSRNSVYISNVSMLTLNETQSIVLCECYLLQDLVVLFNHIQLYICIASILAVRNCNHFNLAP